MNKNRKTLEKFKTQKKGRVWREFPVLHGFEPERKPQSLASTERLKSQKKTHRLSGLKNWYAEPKASIVTKDVSEISNQRDREGDPLSGYKFCPSFQQMPKAGVYRLD